MSANYAFPTLDDYKAAAAKFRARAVGELGRERFKFMIGGLENELEVFGMDPADGHLVGVALETVGAVVKGELVHFDRDSLPLIY